MRALILEQEQIHGDGVSAAGARDDIPVQHQFKGVRVDGVILGRADQLSLGAIGEGHEAELSGGAVQRPHAVDAHQRVEIPADLPQLPPEDPPRQDHLHHQRHADAIHLQ